MTKRIGRLILPLAAVGALGISGPAWAAPPSSAAPETAGEAPESTGPENSATDPDNVQYEDNGTGQGDNGNTSATGASHTRNHRGAKRAAQRTHKAKSHKRATTRH